MRMALPRAWPAKDAHHTSPLHPPDRRRASKTGFKPCLDPLRAKISSGSLQERSKSPSRGLQQASCAYAAVWEPFPMNSHLPREASGPQKPIEILRAVCKFRGFAIFGSSRLSSSMSDPLWRLLGGPRSLKPVLNLILDRPRAVQEWFWRAPKASKSAPSRLREPSRPPRCPSASPKRSQRPNKRPRGCSKRPPGRNFQPRGPLKRSAKRTKNTLDPSEQH